MLEINHFSPVEGAEARIELIDWYDRPAIRKLRLSKKYRNQILDETLRSRRTKEEAEILHSSKLAQVDCPEIFFADPKTSELVMEFIPGSLLKDYLASGLQRAKLFKSLGKMVARLHKKGIIHGDLTTKNVILSQERMVLIDFGLSFVSDRLEDKAEDLHLLKQALKSSSPANIASRDFENVMSGYQKEIGEAFTKSLRKQISKIELRGRYAKVD
ncbi:MAG: KEOPS complex kinase/ATPase Bud32 [Thaumarchaeota archaeon]|nr:KEOPS complex kinase/ATPase Bud32 [Nitrososphaerota archaeon]